MNDSLFFLILFLACAGLTAFAFIAGFLRLSFVEAVGMAVVTAILSFSFYAIAFLAFSL